MKRQLRAGLFICLCLVSCENWRDNRIPKAAELSSSARRALSADLEAMANHWDDMATSRGSRRHKAENKYENALSAFLTKWTREQSPREWRHGQAFDRHGQNGRFIVEFETVSASKSPQAYDDFVIPERATWSPKPEKTHRPGLGVPVVGCVKRRGALREETLFLPPQGGHFTLTACMSIQPQDESGTRRCRLLLLNSLDVDTIASPDGDRQLAADFTLAKHLALSRKAFGGISIQGLLYPEKAMGDCQLYRMDEYDPQRIPVVFVHGLMSDPHIWLNMVSTLCADPVLRKRYQPWYFLYPTAMGVPQAAAMLRKSLETARAHFDPDHNDPGMHRMVLVGHSMGGLLSRMQVTDSGSKLWDGIFSRPPHEINVSENVRASMTEALFVKPLPYVERVIFIATPHRGSKIASLNIVRRLTSLIRIPLDSLMMVNEILYGNMDALSPQITKWGVFSFISIGMLSERHPLLKGLNETTPAVDHHSIIGDRGRRVPRENSSDGVVPYWSSHLSTAESETMVPHGHGCVEEADVVHEVLQLLHEHLEAR